MSYYIIFAFYENEGAFMTSTDIAAGTGGAVDRATPPREFDVLFRSGIFVCSIANKIFVDK